MANNIATSGNFDVSSVTGDNPEIKQVPNQPNVTYGSLRLKYHGKSCYYEFPEVTSRGIGVLIDENTRKESMSCYWQLEESNPEHMVAREDMIKFYEHVGLNLIMPNKGALASPRFFCANPDGTFNYQLADGCFKRLLNYPKDKQKMMMFDKTPGVASKIIDWKYTRSTFKGINGQEIPWAVLKGPVEIKHRPLVLFDSVYCGRDCSIQCRLVSSIVTEIKPAGESDLQNETQKRLAEQNPESVSKFEEQMAALMMGGSGSNINTDMGNISPSYHNSGITVPQPEITVPTPNIPSSVAPQNNTIAQMQSISGSLPAQVNLPQNNTVTSNATEFLTNAPSRTTVTPPITSTVTVPQSTSPVSNTTATPPAPSPATATPPAPSPATIPSSATPPAPAPLPAPVPQSNVALPPTSQLPQQTLPVTTLPVTAPHPQTHTFQTQTSHPTTTFVAPSGQVNIPIPSTTPTILQ